MSVNKGVTSYTSSNLCNAPRIQQASEAKISLAASYPQPKVLYLLTKNYASVKLTNSIKPFFDPTPTQEKYKRRYLESATDYMDRA